MQSFTFELPQREEAPPRPHIEAQKMELLGRFASVQESPTVKVGDLCVFKRGLSTLKPEGQETHVFILWRMLDRSDPIDQAHVEEWSRVPHDRPDCLLGSVSDDGSCIQFMPAQLTHLERVV